MSYLSKLFDAIYGRIVHMPEKRLLIIIAVLVGVATALIVSLFEAFVLGLKDFFSQFSSSETNGNYVYLFLPLTGIIIVTLFVKYFVKDNISHGVTRVLKAITHNRAALKVHNMFSSVIAGAVTIGFGGSVGPEAPIIMTGSAIGSNIARVFKMGGRSTTILLACGAAGALAAIFKAPITGVVFVLEVLLIDLSMATIIPILITAVTSTSLIYMIHGFEPVFAVQLEEAPLMVGHLPYYLILGVLCGLVGCYVIFFSAKIESLFRKMKHQYIKWIVGGTIIGALVFYFPSLYGQGYESISMLLSGDSSQVLANSIFFTFKDSQWTVLALFAAIVVTKVIAMASTNAAGGVGGVFAPSLFMGAFTGYFTAMLLNLLFGIDLPIVPFVLVGMAGVMSGAMDAPLTAIFLLAEITGGYKLFLPLMLASAIAYAISYYFTPYSVYTRELVLDGDNLSLTKDRSMFFIEIDNIIEKGFVSIKEETTLGDMVKAVEQSKRNLFPVVKNNGKLVGYVTLDDIRGDMFKRELYNYQTAKNYMTIARFVIKKSDTISAILNKFDNSGTWNLPVVSEEGAYIGFISKSKIFSEYRNLLKENA
ncbi:MAG: chloride channel protein [Rikenellaceae bacterium]